MLRLIARGNANKQVAAALGISPKTVGRHIEHIYAKAGVSTRAGATLVRHGARPALTAESPHMGRTPDCRVGDATARRLPSMSDEGAMSNGIEGDRPAGRRRHIDRRVGRGHRAGAGDGPRLDRRPHDVRARSWPSCGAELTTFAMDRRGFGASGDARRLHASSRTSRTSPPSSTPSPPAPAGRSPCGDTPTAPTARWAAPRSPATSTTSSSTNPAWACPTRQVRSSAIEAALARGDNDAAIVAVLVDILEMSEEEIDGFRASPLWPVRLAAAPTDPAGVPRRGGLGVPAGSVRHHHRPTMFLAGSDSVPVVNEATERAAAAVPDARIHVLEGHGHFAHRTEPAMVTAVIREWVTAATSGGRAPLRSGGGELGR